MENVRFSFVIAIFVTSPPAIWCKKWQMFEISAKAQFFLNLHKKHRNDIKCQVPQNGYVVFLIFCDFDPQINF